MAIYYSGSRSAADRQMAALEFYSGDSEEKAWIVYSGTGECRQLPTPGTSPSPSPGPSHPTGPDVRRRRRNADMWTCRRRSSNPSDSDYGFTPDGYVCSGNSIVPGSSSPTPAPPCVTTSARGTTCSKWTSAHAESYGYTPAITPTR